MEQKDYYQELGVSTDATSEKVKAAYHKLAFENHPDRQRDNPGANAKMKAINEAYAVLSDAQKRQAYDAMRQQHGGAAYTRFRADYSEQDIFRGTDLERIFNEMARSFGLRGFGDIAQDLYGQGFRRFHFRGPGIRGGGFFFMGPLGRRMNRGTPLMSGGYGRLLQNLLGKLTGMQLPQKGTDIFEVISLTPEHARQGGPYAYFLRRRSKRLVVKIPPGTKEGQKIRLAQMGEPGHGGGPSGDLYLKVKLKKPLLEKLGHLLSSKHR